MQTVPTFSNFSVFKSPCPCDLIMYAVIVNKQSRIFRLKYPAPDATVKIMLIKMSKMYKTKIKFYLRATRDTHVTY